MLEALRKSIARAIRPAKKPSVQAEIRRALREELKAARASMANGARVDTRMYQSARPSRLNSPGFVSTTSADSELVSSLTNLRNRSRQLVRDAAYAKRAKVIIQNNVVGSGIGLQAKVMATRGQLRETVNDDIEEAWEDWACGEYCHTGGALHFSDLERAIMAQVFEAGEAFIRLHFSAFGGSEVPLGLELIEAERIADELQYPIPAPYATSPKGAVVRMGVEVDPFGRPIAYWIREQHPADLRWIVGQPNRVERVPAEQIIHLRLIDRWPQTRGEPWLHATAGKLNDMDGYSEAEIVAARAGACISGTIETPNPNSALVTQIDGSGSGLGAEVQLEAGTFQRLAPGEELKPFMPNRPNSAFEPFMRAMLREMAAGTGYGISYEALSRDYSQHNYSSQRAAMLDDRDSFKVLQQWFIRNFRWKVHKIWLKQAVLARAVSTIGIAEYALDPEKFECCAFKARGWGWIDPTKEVQAYEDAIKAGLTTRADVIAATADGRDIEDVDQQRAQELLDEEQLQLEFTTSPSVYIPAVTGSERGTGQPVPQQGEPGDSEPSVAEGEAAAGGGSSPSGGQPAGRVVKLRR